VLLYTIGFAKKSAARFFGLLNEHRIDLVADIRLRPDGQLSAFARKGDLPYFLHHLVGGKYIHLPILSPTDDILNAYRKEKDWSGYVRSFEQLMDDRDVPNALDRASFEEHAVCLLCSEASPKRCHRRLVAERLARTWESVEVIHLT
jgi:uncharacterized protein (DUF488 family)